MGIAQKIVDEIKQKVEDYESSMSGFMSDYNDWADIFRVKRKTGTGGLKTYSNPRSTEMFRAVNALATMEYRMMTSQDPYFEAVPMDILGNHDTLTTIEQTLDTQLRASQHKRYLLKAITSKILFGTVIVEEPFEIIGMSPFGRKMPVTAFKPRSMLQVAFDRNATDLDDADWVTTADIVSNERLRRMAKDDPEQDSFITDGINAALNDKTDPATISTYIINRLTSAGYFTPDSQKNVKELIIYNGKLDAMDDGIEYICGLVNRKHLVKFHPNNFQHGKRQMRVARWVEFELEPLAMGLGKLLSPLHKSIDANRQRVQDSVAFDTYGLWVVNRLAGIAPNSFKIRPNHIIDADDVNALRRIEANPTGADLGIKLETLLQQEFRAASGATDTLQALITEATASEVSLAQNEAVRAISVRSEIAAGPLVREHLEIMHSNNMQNITDPFNININGVPKRVYPSDLIADVDFRVKVTTDKDYKPERLKKLTEILQILTSIRNEHPQKYDIDIVPIVEEIARSLGVGVDKLVKPAQPININPMAGGGGIPTPGPGSLPPDAINTFVGPVLASPQ